MKKTVILCFWLFSICVFSQNNLVPNPSFEEKNPTSNSTHVAFIKNWMGANGSPGDYYFRNNPDKSSDVPKSIFGNQEPHTGNAYTAICIENDFAEYVEAELLKPLVKGQEYKISFFISKADKKILTLMKWGCFFYLRKKHIS
jgi:OmpA-OmpF porin, OOP family